MLSPDEQRQFDDLEFGIKRSIRYHNHRRLFFDRLDKCIKIFSLGRLSSGAYRNVRSTCCYPLGY